MNQFYGEHLYSTSQHGPRVLCATYDEHRARREPDHPVWGFFEPYGQRTFDMDDGDILRQTDVATARGCVYRIDLAIEFMQRNQLAVVPPWPKLPVWESGWAPYRSVGNFCERIASFHRAHPVQRALAAIVAQRQAASPVGQAFAALAGLDGDSSPDMRERAHLAARIHLGQALREDQQLWHILESGLPENLPETQRASDEEPTLSDRAVWRFRLLYSLVLALHDQRI